MFMHLCLREISCFCSSNYYDITQHSLFHGSYFLLFIYLSITAAIGMPYLGSRGATKSQIEERLGFSTYEDYVGGVFQLIHNSVNNPGKEIYCRR